MFLKTGVGFFFFFFSGITASFLREGVCLLKGTIGIFQQDINLILGAKKKKKKEQFL